MMNLQYISDSKGQTTGVFIPINEWNELKNKYKEIEEEESNVPSWHKVLVKKRIENFRNEPDSALDFETSIAAIEKEL